CLSLHITSFRSKKPYSMREASARALRRTGTTSSSGHPLCRMGRRTGQQLERLVECRIAAGREWRRQGHLDIGREARAVDPALVRGQPAGDGQLEGTALTAQLLPLLDGALPERLLADETGTPCVLECARDDLAGR